MKIIDFYCPKYKKEELRCKECGKIIPDIVASYEDEFCSEDCFRLYQDKEEGSYYNP